MLIQWMSDNISVYHKSILFGCEPWSSTYRHSVSTCATHCSITSSVMLFIFALCKPAIQIVLTILGQTIPVYCWRTSVAITFISFKFMIKQGIINLFHMYKITNSEKEVNCALLCVYHHRPKHIQIAAAMRKNKHYVLNFLWKQKFLVHVFYVIISSSENLYFLQILVIQLKLKKPHQRL